MEGRNKGGVGRFDSCARATLLNIMAYKKLDKPKLHIGERWCKSFLVTYPVSYRYNGGTIVDGEWYEGYEVPPPDVPKGFSLVGIGCGLQLNAHPPYATAYLKPDEDRKILKKELKALL